MLVLLKHTMQLNRIRLSCPPFSPLWLSQAKRPFCFGRFRTRSAVLPPKNN